MKRLALLLGTLALANTFHARAQAQAIENPLIVKREGDQVTTQMIIYGTVEDCEDNAEYEFGMDFPATVPIWEAWLGVGSSANCGDVNSRKRADATAQNPVCKLLGVDRQASAKPRIKVNARDMFSKDWGATDCDKVRNQAYTVFLVPLEQETNLSANSATMPLMVGTHSTKRATFTLYTLPPDAPTGITAQPGEERIGVKFKIMEGAQVKTRYRAYFDWGTGGSGACGSGALGDLDAGVATGVDAGAALDASPDADAGTESDAEVDTDAAAETAAPLRNKARPPDEDTPNVYVTGDVSSGEAYMGNLDAKGIEIGDSVAVSVVTLDAADNESDLSTPICVERIETSSFLDNCQTDPDCKGGFNACSVSPAQRTGGLVGLGSLLALATALMLRRRRHV